MIAAGEGRRLRPLSERWPKPILPIDGKPVIATLLQELAGAGIGPVTVVVGHLGDQVRRLLAGLDVRFAEQPEPLGSADAVRAAIGGGARAPFFVSVADTVFGGRDVARFAAEFARSGVPGAVAVRRDPPPGAGRAAVEVEAGRVVRIAGTADSGLAHASLWGLGPALVPYLAGLPGPPYELAEAYQRAIGEGHEVPAIEVGRTRDLTDPLDLVEENFPYLSR